MTFLRGTVLVAITAVLGACEGAGNTNGITDGGYDSGALEDGVANIWVDPDGCQHWYVDDGIEGYMSPRLRPDGTPMCRDSREVIIMKDGTRIVAEPEPTID